ncbi:unnamed protein product [Urochloa humidicola]
MATAPTRAATADGSSAAAAGGGVDGRSGYCATTRTFCSLRPAVPLPPASAPLSFPAFAFSHLLPPSTLPARAALLDAATGEELSFPAFLSQTRALAAVLRSPRVGIHAGDVAFVLAPSRLDLPVLYYALLSLGAVVSPANPVLTTGEVARLVAMSGATVAFAVSTSEAKLPAGIPTVLLDSDRFRSFLHSDDEENLAPVDTVAVRQSDTAAIQYSSGTTGLVKAVALSHRSFIAMVARAHALLKKPLMGHERVLLGAPMFHSMGFLVSLQTVALGLTLVVMTDTTRTPRTGVKGMLEAAEKWAVTEMWASPPVVVTMAKGIHRLDTLERVICGGAPLPTATAEMFQRRFPHVELCVGYGSTEAGNISLMIGKDECSRVGSAGRIWQHVEVKVVDHITGEPLSVGQEGELWVRGPAVMTGYVGDDKANAATIDPEGWLKTGDLCYVDQDGFLFVVDGLKELIKYKGYQVPPAELELVLQSLPEIADAAVVPYPDAEAGQIPMALVVRHPASKLTEAEVMNHAAKQVAPYKKIRKVLFVNSIPRSAAGKILRRQLLNYAQFGAFSRL